MNRTLWGSLAVLLCCVSVTLGQRLFTEDIGPECKAVIYVTDPVAVMDGTSSCPACDRLIADLRTKYKIKATNKRIVGTTNDSIFEVRKAPSGVKAVPLVVYYHRDGRKDYVQGYKGDHKTIALKHPAFGGEGGNRENEPETYMVGTEIHADDGFSARGAKVQTLSFSGEASPEPTIANTTPFIPELDLIPERPRVRKEVKKEVAQLGYYPTQSYRAYSASCNGGGGYYTPPQRSYSQSCSGAQSYSYPTQYYRAYSSSCNGGGGMTGGGGGYYTPPQRSYYTPTYGVSSYNSGGGQWVCGPNGCYFVN